MMIRRVLLSSLLLAIACGDDDGAGDDGGVDMAMDVLLDPSISEMGEEAGMEAGIEAGMEAGTEIGVDMALPPLCPTADVILDPVDGTVDFMQIGSDFVSTAITLGSFAEGTLAADWINSGTTAPALTTTLSGDVVFPSSPGIDGVVTIIDRTTSVVSRFCVASGSLIGQANVGGEGFVGNPHDVVIVGVEGFASRYNPNLTPDAEEIDLGDDIFLFDARNMVPLGERIALDTWAGEIEGVIDGAPGMVTIAARPDRMVLVGDTLAVGLDRQPIDQGGPGRAAGEGTLVLIDLESRELSSVTLPGGLNCGQVVPVEGSDNRVAVTCKGYSTAFFGGPGTRESSGLYIVEITDGTGTVVESWQPGADDTAAVWNVFSLGGTLVAGVEIGEFMVSNDVFAVVDVADGTVVDVFEAGGSFVLGQGIAVDGGGRVPDSGGAPGTVRSFTFAGGVGSEGASSIFSDSLPAAGLYRF
ncbi:MAG: hypothetical protein AAF411_02790 [Myxococcota bacterium]